MLKINQVAEKLSVNRVTVSKMIQTGQLKAVKIGDTYRVSDEALDQFLSACEYKPTMTVAGATDLTVDDLNNK